MDVKEVAALLGVTVGRVRPMLKSSQLGRVAPAGRARYNERAHSKVQGDDAPSGVIAFFWGSTRLITPPAITCGRVNTIKPTVCIINVPEIAPPIPPPVWVLPRQFVRSEHKKQPPDDVTRRPSI